MNTSKDYIFIPITLRWYNGRRNSVHLCFLFSIAATHLCREAELSKGSEARGRSEYSLASSACCQSANLPFLSSASRFIALHNMRFKHSVTNTDLHFLCSASRFISPDITLCGWPGSTHQLTNSKFIALYNMHFKDSVTNIELYLWFVLLPRYDLRGSLGVKYWYSGWPGSKHQPTPSSLHFTISISNTASRSLTYTLIYFFCPDMTFAVHWALNIRLKLSSAEALKFSPSPHPLSAHTRFKYDTAIATSHLGAKCLKNASITRRRRSAM